MKQVQMYNYVDLCKCRVVHRKNDQLNYMYQILTFKVTDSHEKMMTDMEDIFITSQLFFHCTMQKEVINS